MYSSPNDMVGNFQLLEGLDKEFVRELPEPLGHRTVPVESHGEFHRKVHEGVVGALGTGLRDGSVCFHVLLVEAPHRQADNPLDSLEDDSRPGVDADAHPGLAVDPLMDDGSVGNEGALCRRLVVDALLQPAQPQRVQFTGAKLLDRLPGD